MSLTVGSSGLAGQEPEPDSRVGFIEAYYAPFSATLGASVQLQLRNSVSGYAGLGHSIREDSAGSYVDLGLSWDQDVFGLGGYLRGGVRIRRRFSGESMSDVTQVRGTIELGARFGRSWIRPFLSFRVVVFDPGPYGVDWSVGMAFPFRTGAAGRGVLHRFDTRGMTRPARDPVEREWLEERGETWFVEDPASAKAAREYYERRYRG